MANVVPTCLSLILCEAVERVRGTTRAIIVGVFHAIYMKEFPSKLPSFCIWLEVTNANGIQRLDLIFERMHPDAPEWERFGPVIRATLTFEDPNGIYEYSAHVGEGSLELPVAGLYRVRLESEGASLQHRMFTARLTQEGT